MKYRLPRSVDLDVFAMFFDLFTNSVVGMNTCIHVVSDKNRRKVLADEHFYVVRVRFEPNLFSIKYHFPKSLLLFNRIRPDLAESYCLSDIDDVVCVRSLVFENMVYVYVKGEADIVFGFREQMWSAFRAHCIETGDKRIADIVAAFPSLEHSITGDAR